MSELYSRVLHSFLLLNQAAHNQMTMLCSVRERMAAERKSGDCSRTEGGEIGGHLATEAEKIPSAEKA